MKSFVQLKKQMMVPLILLGDFDREISAMEKNKKAVGAEENLLVEKQNLSMENEGENEIQSC